MDANDANGTKKNIEHPQVHIPYSANLLHLSHKTNTRPARTFVRAKRPTSTNFPDRGFRGDKDLKTITGIWWMKALLLIFNRQPLRATHCSAGNVSLYSSSHSTTLRQ